MRKNIVLFEIIALLILSLVTACKVLSPVIRIVSLVIIVFITLSLIYKKEIKELD